MSLDHLRLFAQEYRPHLMAVGLFALGGFGFGVIQISVSSGTSQQSEPWSLPKAQVVSIAPITDDDIAARFWSEKPREPKKKADAAPKTPVGVWRFLGTVDQGALQLAVVAVDGDRVRQLKIGDALPDNAVITEISSGAMAYTRDGGVQTIRLFLEKQPDVENQPK